MARRGGLGKGLGALIPPGGTEGATGARWARRAAPGVDQAEPVPAARPLRRGGAGAPGRLDPRGRRAPAGPGASGRRRRVRADRGRAPLAGGPAGRSPDHPRAGARDRRRRRARAGAGREPPPRRPQPARGGRRLPAAHRGLRPHPRRGRGPGRPEPRDGDQHPAPHAAPAGDPEVGAGGQALDGPRPRAARVTRSLVPGAAREADRRRGPLGAGGRRGGARAPGRERERARAGHGADDATRAPTGAGCVRRACSSSRSCSATTSRPGSRSRWAAAGARSWSSSRPSRTSSGSTGS